MAFEFIGTTIEDCGQDEIDELNRLALAMTKKGKKAFIADWLKEDPAGLWGAWITWNKAEAGGYPMKA